MYKYYFLSGAISDSISLKFKDLILQFLDGEFISASRNLQVLINNKEYTESLFNGYGILNDFKRIFFKSEFSHGNWFQNTFFSYSKTGYGFTLVGEGYVNLGYFGVILVFVIIGLFIRIIYRKASRNIYFLSIYIYTIPLYMYAIRADLANIFSQFIKHLILSIFIIYVLELVSYSKYRKIKKGK